MRVVVIGTGYVGLVSGACLAELGHDVTCVDTDARKIALLEEGKMPIYEPGLEVVVKRNVEAGRLRFSTGLEDVPRADVISIAVGTPSAADGSVDLQFVYDAVRGLACLLKDGAVVALKSTVPVGTAREARLVLREVGGFAFVVSNPEFLREGKAIEDFLRPTRIVLGVDSVEAEAVMLELYKDIDCPKLVMDSPSAELAKYASNAFLATKISFANEMSHLCEEVGADVESVTRVMGFDPRIGKDFLRVGPGWGGGCFPKDVTGLKFLGDSVDHPLPVVSAAIEMNRLARVRVVHRMMKLIDGIEEPVVAVLGIAFKGDTDDARESPATDLMKLLEENGVTVRAYDPQARVSEEQHGVRATQFESAREAAEGAHALLIATEWSEFRDLDLVALKNVMLGDVLFDARNMLEQERVERSGFRYFRVGR